MGAGLHTNCVSMGAGLHTNCVSNVSMGAGHHTSCVSMGTGHLCNVNIITLATLSHTPIRPSLVVSSSKLFSDLNFQQNITPINTKQLQYV